MDGDEWHSEKKVAPRLNRQYSYTSQSGYRFLTFGKVFDAA